MTHWRLLTLLLAFVLAGCSNQAHTEQSYRSPYYSEAELDQMLAPIALYPDVVLSQILMAATYPEDINDAAAWSYANPQLSGSRAVDAVEPYSWDPSVKSLVAFPDLLNRLAAKPDWTMRLGDAYLAQEGDVIASIQRLRDSAYRSNHLDRMEHLHAYRDNGIIIIEPINPGLVYLPYYRPQYVYGDWWWPDYQPYYWDTPRGYSSGLSFYWGQGIPLNSGFFYSSFHWQDRHVILFDRHDYYAHGSHGRYYRHYKNPTRWERQPHGYDRDSHGSRYRQDRSYPNHPSQGRDWERQGQDWERHQGGTRSDPGYQGQYPNRQDYPNDQRQQRQGGYRPQGGSTADPDRQSDSQPNNQPAAEDQQGRPQAPAGQDNWEHGNSSQDNQPPPATQSPDQPGNLDGPGREPPQSQPQPAATEQTTPARQDVYQRVRQPSMQDNWQRGTRSAPQGAGQPDSTGRQGYPDNQENTGNLQQQGEPQPSYREQTNPADHNSQQRERPDYRQEPSIQNDRPQMPSHERQPPEFDRNSGENPRGVHFGGRPEAPAEIREQPQHREQNPYSDGPAQPMGSQGHQGWERSQPRDDRPPEPQGRSRESEGESDQGSAGSDGGMQMP